MLVPRATRLETATLELLINVGGEVVNLPKRWWSDKQMKALLWALSELRFMRRFASWGSTNYPDDPLAKFVAGDWRQYVCEILESRGMKEVDKRHFNPDKGVQWTKYDAYDEEIMRDFIRVHLMFIGRLNRSTVSICELLAMILYGWDIYPVIEMMSAGIEIAGQTISEIEIKTFNNMRAFVIEIAEAMGKTIYGSLEEMAMAIPIDPEEMRVNRYKNIDSMQRSAVKAVLKNWGMDEFSVAPTIEISSDPFRAQLEVLGALAACLVRTNRITIMIPAVNLWEGMVVGGVPILDRRFKDMARIVDPYFEALLARGNCTVAIIRC